MSKGTLNLDQLATFAAVVHAGSFSAAALRIGVSQPAVSLQIRQLEEHLGVLLVERTGRGSRPTLAGSELMRRVARIDGAVAEAIDAMQPYREQGVGRLRIGTGATACIFFLPPILHDLRARFPDLEILVRTGNTSDLLVAVENRQIDIGLLTLPARGQALQTKTLLSEELVAVTSPNGPPLPEHVRPEDLASVPFIGHSPAANTTKLLQSWCLPKAVALAPVMELESVEAIKELIAAGLGCAVLPRMAVTSSARAGQAPERRLQVHSLRPRLERKLGLVKRRDRHWDWALRELAEALESFLHAAQGMPEDV